MGMSSYSIGISGLQAAQTGLSVTGHNISNSEVSGYTRQSSIQKSFKYQNKGLGGTGLLQVGLGTDVSTIRQIRSQLYDSEYREQSTIANYYATKYVTGQEVENILGELESSYAAQDVLKGVWTALNELSIYPEGIETRGSLIQTCVTFLNKMKDMSTGLYEYQLNLNEQIKSAVKDINDTVSQINVLNDKITYYEACGDNANDFRDQRNSLLDKLSTYLSIDYKEAPNGRVDITTEGKELLVNNSQNFLGLKYSASNNGFVEPVFTKSEEILSSSADVISVFPNLDTENLSGQSGNCTGLLKGLMVSRGNVIADYTTSSENVKNYLIPTVKQKIDNLVNSIATLLNDTFASGDSFDLEGGTGVPIFTLIDEKGDYTIDNMQINPELLTSDGYNKLALSATGQISDTTLILEVTKAWEEGLDKLNGESVNNYYRSIVDDLALEVNEAGNYYDESTGLADSINNKRMTISGVSLDEELSNMLKYQYAYQAASKVINIIDSMIDKVVNGTAV